MKVIVIGGTGNISGAIVKRLLQQGNEVVCYNRGETSTLPKDVRFIQGDRRNREKFESVLRKERFDAAIDVIGFTAEDAKSSIRALANVGHFIQISTTCTYGIDYDLLPVGENHPLRPISEYGRNKMEADMIYMEAHKRDGFPVTIVKPSTTYGPVIGLLRQVAWEFSWVDRIRRGKPLLVCGDGISIHQFMHVDDAANAFASIIGRQQCIGETYNLVGSGFTTWAEHHRTAMRVIGKEVELVGVPLADLMLIDPGRFAICADIFSHNCYYSADKLARDIPEFTPAISLEAGMQHVIEAMDHEGRIPDSRAEVWEDAIILAQRKVRKVKI